MPVFKVQPEALGILELGAADTEGDVPAEVIAGWKRFPKESCYSFLTRAAEIYNMPPQRSFSVVHSNSLSSPVASFYNVNAKSEKPSKQRIS